MSRGGGLSEWVEREADERRADEVAGVFGLPRPIARAVVARGMEEDADIKSFLSPGLGGISDPFCIANMEKACRRLWDAVSAGQRILVYGDYDCDGLTASALLYRFLKQSGHDEVEIFIPDRLDDGYGLIADCIKRCVSEYKPDLIITVDCGVNSFDEVELIKSMGVDVIVTDHHEPAQRTAAPSVLVNPKIDSPSKMAHLAGVGVAFMLAYGTLKISRAAGINECADIRDLLGLVALGSVTDIVPLLNDNRIMASAGIERWRRGKAQPGISALMENCQIVPNELDAWHLGFLIGPRINAAGRLGKAAVALKTLITDDMEEARELAASLEAANVERKKLEDLIFREASLMVEKSGANEKGIVVADRGWHAGTLGIVASRLSGRFNRPAVVLTADGDDRLKGSCRSIKGVNLVEVLDECSRLLLSHGGHAMAAGVGLKSENLQEFSGRFAEACAGRCIGDEFPYVIEFDGWLKLPELTIGFCESLKIMAPLGMGNPAPLWGLSGLKCSEPRVLKEKHLSFIASDGVCSLKVIGFNMAERLAELSSGKADIICEAKLNSFRGRTSVDLILKDLRAE